MWLRISAFVLRYYYLHRRSIARIMEIFFWPVMNLLVWGYLTMYLQELAAPRFVVFLLGGIILWDVLYRSQQGITLTITEEFWVKNIINIFIAPVRMVEIIIGICIVGLVKALVTTALLGLLAYLFFSYDLLTVGLPLAPFFGSLLLFGWAVGLFTLGLIFRYGRAAEALIWGVPFLIQPISAVFYPVTVLPVWLQKIAYLIPSTYVFEGMRHALRTGTVDWRGLTISFGLNLLYLGAGSLYFAWMMDQVREKGFLTRLNME